MGWIEDRKGVGRCVGGGGESGRDNGVTKWGLFVRFAFGSSRSEPMVSGYK